MKTVALMSVFNEQDLLEESVSSIAPYVDRVVIFDGPYDEYPKRGRIIGSCEFSADNTPAIALRLQERFRNIRYESIDRQPEAVKRSIMLNQLEEGDLAFVIDGDELAYGDVEIGILEAKSLLEKNTVAYIRVLDIRTSKDWRPRFILKDGSLKYQDWIRLYSNDRIIFDLKKETAFQPRITQFSLANLRLHYRSEDRERDGAKCKEALLSKVMG